MTNKYRIKHTFSMKYLKLNVSVKEQTQGIHSSFEPISATLLLPDWPIFS